MARYHFLLFIFFLQFLIFNSFWIEIDVIGNNYCCLNKKSKDIVMKNFVKIIEVKIWILKI